MSGLNNSMSGLGLAAFPANFGNLAQRYQFAGGDPTAGLLSPEQGNGSLGPLSSQEAARLDQGIAQALRQKAITDAALMRQQATAQMPPQGTAGDGNQQPQPPAPPATTAPPTGAQPAQMQQPAQAGNANPQPQTPTTAATTPTTGAQPAAPVDPKTLSAQQLAPMVQESAKDLKSQWEAVTQALSAAHGPVDTAGGNLYKILKRGNDDAAKGGPVVEMDISEFTHKPGDKIPLTPEASQQAQDALRELRAKQTQQKEAIEQADNAGKALIQKIAAHRSLAQTMQDKQSDQQKQQLAALDQHPVTQPFADEFRQLAAQTQQYLNKAPDDAAQQSILNDQRQKEQEIRGRLNAAIESYNGRVKAHNRETTLRGAGQQLYQEEEKERASDGAENGLPPGYDVLAPYRNQEVDWVTQQMRDASSLRKQAILEKAGVDRETLAPYVDDAAKMDFAYHGAPAVVLHDGSIRVSPALWLDPKAYKEAVESVAPADGVAKMEALEAFPALSQKAGADLAHQAANVPQINEVLQSMPGDTPAEKALAFADALRTKSGFWDKLNARVSGAVDSDITGLIPSVFSALYGAGAAIGLPTKELQKDAQASAQYWKERGQMWDWVAKGIPSGGGILGAVSDDVTDLAGAGTSMLPMLVAGEFAPVMGATQELGRSYTDAYEAYVQQGKSEDEARSLALVPAVTNAALEYAAFKIPGPQGVRSVFTNPTTAKEAITASLKQMVRNVGVTSAFEFGRMGVDSMAKDVVRMMTYDPQMTPEEALGRAFQSGLSAAGFAGFTRVVHQGIETWHDRSQASPALAAGDSHAPQNSPNGLDNSGAPAGRVKPDNGAPAQPTAEDPVMRNAKFAAAEASLERITDPRSQMKAKALLEIAKGNVQELTRTQLQSVGLDWKGSELVDAPQKTSPNNPSPEEQMAYVVNGKPVIRDDAVQWLQNENVSPTAAKAIGMSEPTARQKALKKPEENAQPAGTAAPLLNAAGAEAKPNAADPSSPSTPSDNAQAPTPTQQPAEPSSEGSNSPVSPANPIAPTEQAKQNATGAPTDGEHPDAAKLREGIESNRKRYQQLGDTPEGLVAKRQAESMEQKLGELVTPKAPGAPLEKPLSETEDPPRDDSKPKYIDGKLASSSQPKTPEEPSSPGWPDYSKKLVQRQPSANLQEALEHLKTVRDADGRERVYPHQIDGPWRSNWKLTEPGRVIRDAQGREYTVDSVDTASGKVSFHPTDNPSGQRTEDLKSVEQNFQAHLTPQERILEPYFIDQLGEYHQMLPDYKQGLQKISAALPEGYPLVPDLKGAPRALEKASIFYSKALGTGRPDSPSLRREAIDKSEDILRGTILVDRMDQVQQAIDGVVKHFGGEGFHPDSSLDDPKRGTVGYRTSDGRRILVDDRFAKPTPGGYSDVLMRVEVALDHFAEVQVQIPEMLVAKDGWSNLLPDKYKAEKLGVPDGLGHKLFETYRALKGGDPAKSALKKQMINIYSSAKKTHSDRLSRE